MFLHVLVSCPITLISALFLSGECLFILLLCHTAEKNAAAYSGSLLLKLAFYSDEKQTGRKERPRKTKRERERERGREREWEREKTKGVSGQYTGLVISITLGMVPPLTGVWLFSAALLLCPPPLPETLTYYIHWVLSAIVTLITVLFFSRFFFKNIFFKKQHPLSLKVIQISI